MGIFLGPAPGGWTGNFKLRPHMSVGDRIGAWVSNLAERFADFVEDWADSLEPEAPLAPGGPYRARVAAPPAEPEAQKTTESLQSTLKSLPRAPRAGERVDVDAALRRMLRPPVLPVRQQDFWAVADPEPPDLGGPHRAPPTVDPADFLGQVARRDPRLAVALLGSMAMAPPAPRAQSCRNCGAPREGPRCAYCGLPTPLERPRPSAGKVGW